MHITRHESVHTSKTDLSVLFSRFFSCPATREILQIPAEKESLPLDAVCANRV